MVRASRPHAVALLAAAVLLVALVGCRPPADGASAAGRDGGVEVTLLTRPARVGPAAVEAVVEHGGARVLGATVRVTGDMTHAGMVPVIADAVELEDGVYRSEGFAFDMAGDWVLTVDVTRPDGGRQQGTLAVNVGR